jgi:hypothetical protein
MYDKGPSLHKGREIDNLQFYVPLKNISVTIAVEGLQNLGLCSLLRAFEQ